MPDQRFPTLIHERVEQARRGENPCVIGRMKSGWAVLGDEQRLRGYSLLLADPIRDNLHELSLPERQQFLMDMAAIGEAIIEVLNPSLINYSILGNTDRALHAHIHPRYEDESPEFRYDHPVRYHWSKVSSVPFEVDRDRPLMETIRAVLVDRGLAQ